MSETIKYINDLAKKNSEALSFIPLPRLEQYLNNGQILLAKENNDFAGFLIYGNGFPVTRIYQACIQYDARRCHHGVKLVSNLIKIANRKKSIAISLYCADDLEANLFWQLSGFQHVGQRPGGKRRGRIHNQWVLPLSKNTLFQYLTAAGIKYE